MQCILEVLRGQAGLRAVAEPEWQSAFALAEEQHVLPLLAQALKEADVCLPHAIEEQRKRAEREARLYGFLQSSELKELLRAFAAAKIAVLPLKGPFLAQRVYGSASLRISRDLDILVHKSDFPAAALLLQKLDLSPIGRADDYHQQFRRGSTIVELHFDIENPLAIDFDVASAWEHACLVDFEGQPAWQLAPADELLYLCLHGVRHRFERLSLVVDIALAQDRLGLGCASEIRLRKQVLDARRHLVLGCSMASRLQAKPRGRQGTVDRATQRTDALATYLWSDLLTKRAEQMDWQTIHAFYLQTELTPLRKLFRRILHWRILMTRLIDADYTFAVKLGLRRTWQVWLLRPVRLLLRRRRVANGKPEVNEG